MSDLATELTSILESLIAPMGAPSAEQLVLINQYRPLGTPEYTAGEIVSVPLMASNNLLTWGQSRWSIQSLEKMAETYPGKPLALDHPWGVKDTVGFVYESQVIQSNAVPQSVLEGAGEGINNSIVIQAEGFYQMVCYAAVEASQPILDAIRYGRVNNVSTGCITEGIYICPLDGTRFGSKSNMRCEEGHYMPHPYIWVEEEDQDMLAPYYIKDGVISSHELSFVLTGNLPAASIPKAG